MRKNGKKWGKWGFKKIFCSFLVLVMISTQCTQVAGADGKKVSETETEETILDETETETAEKPEEAENIEESSIDTEIEHDALAAEPETDMTEEVPGEEDQQISNTELGISDHADTEMPEMPITVYAAEDDTEEEAVAVLAEEEIDERAASIPIHSDSTFPDLEFRAYVAEKIDTNPHDGYLSATEIANATVINLGGTADISETDGTISNVQKHKVTNLKGIEYFTNLQGLNVAYGNLISLDLSSNVNLKLLDCVSNQLTSLNITGCRQLTFLNCGYNNLTTLNLRNNTALVTMGCYKNQLTSLDISQNTELDHINAYSNQISSIDLSNNTALTYLNIGDNLLASLNVGNNRALKTLGCYINQLTTLDLTNNTSLEHLNCGENQLKILKVNHISTLKELYCPANQLTWIDLSGLSLTICYARVQNIGSLSMYYDEQKGLWKNTGSDAVAFKMGLTTFAEASFDAYGTPNAGTALDGEEFFADETGKFTVASKTSVKPEYVYYEVSLANGQKLGGSFQYVTGEIVVSEGYIDVNDAKTLAEKNDLLDYFDKKVARTSYEIQCNDFEQIQTGMVGSYPVTITYGDVSENATLEVGIRIAYQADDGSYVNFPDSKFREIVASFDTDQTGENKGFLTAAEIAAVTEIDLGGSADYDEDGIITKIYQHECGSIKGIEYFTELLTLKAEFGNLTDLDINKNTKLKNLVCRSNQLTALDVTANTALIHLDCGENQISQLDVRNNSLLEVLGCYDNQLTELNLSNNSKLRHLNAHINEITSLTVSHLVDLEELYCAANKLTTLDVTHNLKLKRLDCGRNQLTTIDVTQNSDLEYFSVYVNQLTIVDVTHNPKLLFLNVGDNKLNALDLSYNPLLEKLGCYLNHLTVLDLSHNPKLYHVSCINNQLTTLDVSHLTELEELLCAENQLTSLDVSHNEQLTLLGCHTNQLTSLNLANNSKLEILNCGLNALKTLEVNHLTSLNELYCRGCDLTDLRIDRLEALEALDCAANHLTNLDISKLKNLTAFDATGQTVQKQLCMTYDEEASKWINTAKADLEPVRTFYVHAAHPTAFYQGSFAGTELQNFHVASDGNLQASSVFDIVDTVCFKSAPVDGNGRVWQNTLNGTFSYAPQYTLSAGTLTYSTASIKTLMENVTDADNVTQLAAVKGAITSSPDLSEIKERVTVSMTEKTLSALKAGTLGKYSYTLTLGNVSVTGQISVTPEQTELVEMVEIPAVIVLGRQSRNEAGTVGTIKRVTGDGLSSYGTVEVYADSAVILATEANTYSFTADVYDEDENPYDGEQALAALNTDNMEEKFQLKADVENLAYGKYTGTMNFTIRYREE